MRPTVYRRVRPGFVAIEPVAVRGHDVLIRADIKHATRYTKSELPERMHPTTSFEPKHRPSAIDPAEAKVPMNRQDGEHDGVNAAGNNRSR